MNTASWQSRKTLVAFGSAILTLLVVGAVAYRSATVSNESNKWVRHTHEVLDTLQDLRFAMESIQSNTRGFVLTGKDSYLASYRDSALNAERGEASIRKLTADNPEQQRRLPALEALVAQKVQHAELVIGLRQTKGFEAATDEVRSGLGQQIMDQFQGTVGTLRNEELRLLVLRDADANQHSHETNTVLILGTVLGLLIAGAAGWSVLRDITERKAAENHLAQMEGRYRGLLEAAPDAMVVVNQGGEIVLLNVQAEKRFGYRRDELLGQKVKNIIPEGFAERLIADGTRTEADALAQQIGAGIELSGRRKDGSEFPIEIMLSPLESTEGILVTAAIRDISMRKQAEVQLLEAAMRLRTVAATAVDGLILIDLDGSILMFNRACEHLFGYSNDEVIGQNVKLLMPSPYHEEHDGYLDSYHRTGARKIIGIGREVVGRRKDGTTFPMGLSVGEAMENGRTVFVGNIHDLTERVRGEEAIREVTTAVQAMARKMAHSAEHDLLTGLPNRMLLHDRLSQAIVSARRHKNKVVVLFLDLDGFKHINDSLGHAIGDKLLQSIATRLVLCVRDADTVGRQGGDEFVCCLLKWNSGKMLPLRRDGSWRRWRRLIPSTRTIFASPQALA
jgi:PAS domain S-box-containing protein